MVVGYSLSSQRTYFSSVQPITCTLVGDTQAHAHTYLRWHGAQRGSRRRRVSARGGSEGCRWRSHCTVRAHRDRRCCTKMMRSSAVASRSDTAWRRAQSVRERRARRQHLGLGRQHILERTEPLRTAEVPLIHIAAHACADAPRRPATHSLARAPVCAECPPAGRSRLCAACARWPRRLR